MPECAKIESTQSSLIPTWLTESYIQHILESKAGGKKVRVKHMQLIPSTEKGEGYASVMIRIILEYFYTGEPNTLYSERYLAKIPFEGDELVKKYFGEHQIYEQEMEMYAKFLPEMKTVLRKAGLKENFFPNLLHVDRMHRTIIFEDLSAKKFRCHDRLLGMDLVHAKMVIGALARMHAASVKLNERTPRIFASCDRGLFNRHANVADIFYTNILEHLIDIIGEWDIQKYYIKKLQKLQPFLLEYARRSFDATEGFFNVLSHGDLWSNNIMFKYNDKNEPVDIVLIDFQCSCYTSPALDVNYFMNTSLNDNIRLSHQDELVELYYKNLLDNLKKLDFQGKIPNFYEFIRQFDRKSFYGQVVAGCIVQPLFHNENTEDADFNALLGTDERACKFRRSIIQNPRTQNNLQKLLQFLDKKGLLDVM